jgi:ATP-dependent RNA helicase DDX47/RRP3
MHVPVAATQQVRERIQIEVATKYTTVKTLRQQYLFCPQKLKDTYVLYTMNELSGSTSIVFVRTCDTCRLLSLMLRNLGIGAVPIHGQMTQPKRLASLNKFKSGAPNL